MAERLTTRDQRILEIARRETDPRHADEFEPITRGPFVAALGMFALGIVAIPWLVVTRLGFAARYRRPQ